MKKPAKKTPKKNDNPQSKGKTVKILKPSKSKLAKGGRSHGGWTCEGSGENPF